MMKGVPTMSKEEVKRLNLIEQINSKKIAVKETSEILGLRERPVYRILLRVRTECSKGIVHKLRGRSSNRGYDEEIKAKVIELYKKQYIDYGPVIFSEELYINYKIEVDNKTNRIPSRTEESIAIYSDLEDLGK